MVKSVEGLDDLKELHRGPTRYLVFAQTHTHVKIMCVRVPLHLILHSKFFFFFSLIPLSNDQASSTFCVDDVRVSSVFYGHATSSWRVYKV